MTDPDHLVLLGTSGGPRWRSSRSGIATAIVVGGSVYLVDCGYGAGGQLVRAGLSPAQLRAVLVTHLHSDHTADLANLLLYGWFEGLEDVAEPVTCLGPPSRGSFPETTASGGPAPRLARPEEPAPGFTSMVRHLEAALATDLNDRMRDTRRRDYRELLRVADIELPDGVVLDPDHDAAPDVEPWVVLEDDQVRVTATLVQHAPMAPAFAFRFDTDSGSAVISGDTGPCDNLVRLAQGVDVLVHEVIDEEYVARAYENGRTAQQRAMIAHHLSAHTTLPQVGEIAERAGARTLVLSHFVPGDIDLPRWHEAGKHFSGALVVGEDLMRVPFTTS